MTKPTDNRFPAAWVACVVVGLLALALGFALPALSGGPSDEARSQAAEFLAATRAMEAAASAGSKEERSKRMAEVRDRYRQARELAVETRASSGRTAFWLKVGGGALAAIGCAGAYARSAS